MESLFEKLGGRKFVLTLVILLIGAVIEIVGKNGLSQNMVALLLGASTVFGVANAAVTMKAGELTSKAGPAEGTSTGDEANVKADQLANQMAGLATDMESVTNAQAASIEQLRQEVITQAEALATATKLLKTLMKM